MYNKKKVAEEQKNPRFLTYIKSDLKKGKILNFLGFGPKRFPTE